MSKDRISDKKVGRRIREIREDRNMTQTEFAQPLGVSYRSVARYEEGEVPMMAINLIEFVYRVNRRWLLRGQGVKNVEDMRRSLTAHDIEKAFFLKTSDVTLGRVVEHVMQQKMGWDGIDRRLDGKGRRRRKPRG